MLYSRKEGVYIETLGCPKNVADSEAFKKRLLESGIPLAYSPQEAEFIIVNTCGFIEDAKRESIEEILRLSSFKNYYLHREYNSQRLSPPSTAKTDIPRLVVMGCLVKRYEKELRKELPEVDAFFGLNQEEVIAYLKANKQQSTATTLQETVTSVTELNNSPYAYIKISDGCNRRCSFCVIPKIKGPYFSVEPEEIIQQAEELISRGYKELILVGQDITSYGRDRRGFPSLRDLIREITAISGDFWVRLLYLHPDSLTEELLEEIALNEKVCRYLDIPLQHSEDRILRLMRRPGTKEQYRRLIKKIRTLIPDITIRTTFIVGFPGETEQDFKGLMDFIQEIEFDRLGVFKYSREEGTAAFNLKDQLSRRIKEKRFAQIMRLQAEISFKKNLSMVGKRVKALIDELDKTIAYGRLQSHAPEIDGMVIIKNAGNLKVGEFHNIIITGAYEHDLEAEVLTINRHRMPE